MGKDAGTSMLDGLEAYRLQAHGVHTIWDWTFVKGIV